MEYQLFKIGNFALHLEQLLLILAFIFAAYLLVKLLRIYFRKKEGVDVINDGRAQSVVQLVKYIVIVITISLCLSVVGIDVTILVAGSAALLVGLGFGIQNIFNDIVSGIIILVEGTLKVGDIIETEGVVGRVVHIGLRVSEILSRDNIVLIVPNSEFVNKKVINWSHNDVATRFSVKIGLPYGSDVSVVKELLINAVKKQKEVEPTPEPFTRLSDFGEYSLDFEVFFYCRRMFTVENIRSDIRSTVYDMLAEKGIDIPYPQYDLNVIKPVTIGEIKK